MHRVICSFAMIVLYLDIFGLLRLRWLAGNKRGRRWHIFIRAIFRTLWLLQKLLSILLPSCQSCPLIWIIIWLWLYLFLGLYFFFWLGRLAFTLVSLKIADIALTKLWYWLYLSRSSSIARCRTSFRDWCCSIISFSIVLVSILDCCTRHWALFRMILVVIASVIV